MLQIALADGVGPLADQLAEVLAAPLADPMAAEWIAVPSEGMRRWLELRLATTLGSGGAGRTDGVAANLRLPFPGALRRSVLVAHREAALAAAGEPSGSPDPWHLDATVWTLLDLLERTDLDRSELGPLAHRGDHGSWFSRVRRVAELFDRYAVHRPEMLRAWTRGRNVGPGVPSLRPAASWQPVLWRLLVEAIEHRDGALEIDPAERFFAAVEEVGNGHLALDLPDRISLFGLTALPAGQSFLVLLDALSQQREVNLLCLTPSVPLSQRTMAEARAVRESVGSSLDAPPSPRLSGPWVGLVDHPLVDAWGQPPLETAALLAQLPQSNTATGAAVEPGGATLLATLQADVRANRRPAANHVPDAADRSLQIHACPGRARQVEVLRDALLHLLASDPDLTENDILVICPRLDVFAPLIEAGLGPSASAVGPHTQSTDPSAGAPALRYRISARELRHTDPLSAALSTFLDLVDGRYAASDVLAFAALEPVRRCFGFHDDDLATIADWIDETNARWGLHAAHRARWDLPETYGANSWRSTADQLLMGLAIAEPALATGEVVPCPGAALDIDLVGRFVDLLHTLDDLDNRFTGSRTVGEWVPRIEAAVDSLFGFDQEHLWMLERLQRQLAELREHAAQSSARLTVLDLRRSLDRALGGDPGRSALFSGGVTITSMFPMHWIPHRAIAILGLDDDSLARTGPDGDDLLAESPQMGDGDARREQRHALLQTLLSAESHLVITRTGRDIRTSNEVPPSVALAELLDAVDATVNPESASGAVGRFNAISTDHPRHGFDHEYFQPGSPWSFDGVAAHAGAARAMRPPAGSVPRGLLEHPLEPVELTRLDLGELHRFLANPQAAFLRRRFDVRLPRTRDLPPNELPAEVDPLAKFSLGTDFLAHTIGGRGTGFAARALAGGALPPGPPGREALAEIEATVEEMLRETRRFGIDLEVEHAHPIDVVVGRLGLPDLSISGAVTTRASAATSGPLVFEYRRPSPKLKLRAWLDLVALSVADPEVVWRATMLTRASSSGKDPDVLVEFLEMRAESAEERERLARMALETVVTLYQLGLREPLPLLPKTSEALAKSKLGAAERAYTGSMFPGEGLEPASLQIAGAIDFNEFLTLPALAGDPGGAGSADPGRAMRLARGLWASVTGTTRVVEPEAADRP